MFCIYLRTKSDLCHLEHKLIGFYNRDEKCLLRGMNWVFKVLKHKSKNAKNYRMEQTPSPNPSPFHLRLSFPTSFPILGTGPCGNLKCWQICLWYCGSKFFSVVSCGWCPFLGVWKRVTYLLLSSSQHHADNVSASVNAVIMNYEFHFH